MRARLYKVIEHFYPPYSGAKWIRVQNTWRNYLIASQASPFGSPESFKNEGDWRSSMILSTRVKLKSPCEKKTRWPAQQTAAHATFVSLQRGSTLEYLIGQQRLQSMPHPAPKSRANLN